MRAVSMLIESFYQRTDDDGVVVEVVPLIGGRARITIGDGRAFVDDLW